CRAAAGAAWPGGGRPPLAARGLKLHRRLEAIAASLARVADRAGALPAGLGKLRRLLLRGLEETAPLWPAVRAADGWVKRVARVLANHDASPAAVVRRRLSGGVARMRRAARAAHRPPRQPARPLPAGA